MILLLMFFLSILKVYNMSVTILGAGLAGLSVAHHLNEKYEVYEKNGYAGGHIHSEYINGFTWDEGPHVSFTTNEYVKRFFEYNTDGDILEYPVKTGNYFKGVWIPHPAQSNLFAVPQPLRDKCLKDFKDTKEKYPDVFQPKDYAEWLDFSLGNTFAETFPAAYTRKYWTTSPKNLTTDWVGDRVFRPDVKQIEQGYFSPLQEETHYIKKIRYPNSGGYISFAKKMIQNTAIKFNHELLFVDFTKKSLLFTNGVKLNYEKLISTIPLPLLISKSNAPDYVKNASSELSCTSVLLINVTANHITQRPENWIYVYDEDKYSTRINCTELLSPNNAPIGKSGIQVEVYFSNYKQFKNNHNDIVGSVTDELVEMGILKSKHSIEATHTKWVQWANVIFDHKREEAQNVIFEWLEQVGLIREEDDLSPMTDWKSKLTQKKALGSLILAGRFSQWKYYWTDDCVLRGYYIGYILNEKKSIKEVY